MTDQTNHTETGNTPGLDAPLTAAGKVVAAASITATSYLRIETGFKPKYVCFENATDRIKVEWYEGMADDSCIKTVAAGTRTLEVTGGNGGITVDGRGFRVLQNATLAVVTADDTHVWRAHS